MTPTRIKDFIRYFFGYIIVWILAVYLFSFLRFFGVSEELLGRETIVFNLTNNFWETTSIGVILGIMFILSDFILKKDWLRRHSYITNIFITTVIHSITFYVTFFFYIIFLVPDNGINNLKELFYVVFVSEDMWVVFVYFNLVIIILNLERYVRKIFGPGVMTDIIKGKYFKPRNEERIFLFLDLISSTTYAERLGTLKFTELIQDCFFDVSSVVKKHDAEIYQYVGDEVILTWKKRPGIEKSNAFMTFFSFLNLLNKRSDYYMKKYGVVPEFKAGMHFGIASVAEVGEIKKEIAFLGDAVNTAARLLGMCNHYGKSFLASKEMVDLAASDTRLVFEFQEEMLLKGKQNPTRIFSVAVNEH